jgi:class 3 adenylate cyclase/predicted ATPase
MTFEEILDQAIALLRRRGCVTYRTLKLQFDLDDDHLDALKEELIEAEQLAVDQDGRMLKWTGRAQTAPTYHQASSNRAPESSFIEEGERGPLSYTPQHLVEKILRSRRALEGERKQVTVCFADIKGSTELIRDLDPEDAQELLDPVLRIMMDAVHRFEGTVNQVLGDGIMALFGAPIAHEDHALRACYAALTMQAGMRAYTEFVRNSRGMTLRVRVGLNAGEVVVRTIGNDLHMDYSAVGPTTHLAARMEQLADPGSILLTASTLGLVDGLVLFVDLGRVPVKGLAGPVQVYELTGATGVRGRLQAAAPRGFTKFVGRGRELDALLQVLNRVRSGQGQIVATVGEAGVGKSRLAFEFVHSGHVDGCTVLESASASYSKSTPYFPLIDLLKRYFGVDDSDDPHTIRSKVTARILTLDESLQETIPAILSLLNVLSEDSGFLRLDAPLRRQRTLDGLKRIFLRESRLHPLVLVFEDLHWADSETQALLDSLAESLPAAQVLMLVTYRPEYRHDWGVENLCTELRLAPLTPESVSEFLTTLIGDDSSLGPVKKLLISRAGGNPFFLEECVRTLVETGGLVGEPGAYRLAQDLPGIQVPATVQAVLAARVDRLKEEEKRILQTAAVIGHDVPLSWLKAVVDVSEEVLYRGLTSLQAGKFMYEKNLFPDEIYAFKHALTLDVVYQSLLTSVRQHHHSRMADVLVERFEDVAQTQPELVAHHYTEAGRNEEAVSYWHRAGQRSRAGSAHEEAVVHLTRGLELLERLPGSPERDRQALTFNVSLGSSLAVTRGWAAPEVEEVYTRASDLCEQTGYESPLFPVLWGSSQVYIVRADVPEHRKIAERLLSLASSRQDLLSAMTAHWVMGTNLFHAGNYVASREHTDRSWTLYDPAQHRDQLEIFGIDLGVFGLCYAAHGLWCLGYPELAVQRSREAVTLARELDHSFSLTVAFAYAAMLYQFSRHVLLAREHADTVVALSIEHGFAYYRAWGTIVQGWVGVESGQAEQGLAAIQDGLTALKGTGGGLRLPYYSTVLAAALGSAGRFAEGLRVLEDALADVARTGERWADAELYRLRGELLLQAGEHAQESDMQPEQCFRQALTIARSQQARSWELRSAISLARSWQSRGRRQEAYELLEPLYGWFSEGFDTSDLRDAKQLLADPST